MSTLLLLWWCQNRSTSSIFPSFDSKWMVIRPDQNLSMALIFPSTIADTVGTVHQVSRGISHRTHQAGRRSSMRPGNNIIISWQIPLSANPQSGCPAPDIQGECKVSKTCYHCSNSSIGTSSASFPTIALATFHTWIKLSSAALHNTHGSFIFQLKSETRLVWPPCMNSLEVQINTNGAGS